MSLGFLFAMSLPALVAALFLLAVVERFFRGRRGTPMATAGIGELGATFEAGKRDELEFRKEERQLRDDEGDHAPPRSRVDLDGGTAVLKVPAQRQPS
ncbi:DUF6191 domain-containing protein [Lentzea flaviverrucosa]|uniref:Uncharacterized protein n=1 Tax=Lentzea flaviverrucosa TaxID=200379 RepID=A0A1H9X6P0_9PSEU|nr:DUF6191 domain-containing protein [Lentzea flaviverrucosa]RDI20830.1 hypothetical protein DFR72_11448 [Lentzea flaviverrucosa]SES41303.1 hypothetical protein SAMN05216195_113240 [Lentzea flaviverrucosa]